MYAIIPRLLWILKGILEKKNLTKARMHKKKGQKYKNS